MEKDYKKVKVIKDITEKIIIIRIKHGQVGGSGC